MVVSGTVVVGGVLVLSTLGLFELLAGTLGFSKGLDWSRRHGFATFAGMIFGMMASAKMSANSVSARSCSSPM